MAPYFIEQELLLIVAGIVIFNPFFLWPWLDALPVMYKLDPYFLEVYQMCENELPTSRLLKVIVWLTYRQTYRRDWNSPVVSCYFVLEMSY